MTSDRQIGPRSAAASAAFLDATDDSPKRPIGRYIIGLAMIALLAIASTVLTSSALTRQEKDAGVVSAAANQAVLADELADNAVKLENAATGDERGAAVADMERNLDEIMANHLGLRYGDDMLGLPGDNSAQVEAKFVELEANYEAMVTAAEELIEIGKSGERIDRAPVVAVVETAGEFATGMSEIVFAYQTEAEARVKNLKSTQYLVLSVTIVLLVFEGLFLFRPAVQEFRKEWRQRAEAHLTAREKDQRKLSFLARFDPLTGLINRFLFGDRLQNAIARARRDGGLVTLMFLDLDEFKAVNDRFGHAVGDGLLKQVAERLVDAVRESDSVARLGGDEFTVILEGNHRVEDAGHVATKILRSLQVPYQVGPHKLHVTASIGIALYPVDGQNSQELLRDADIAMYSAKAAGKNTYQYFTPELREKTSERLHLIDGLRRAIEARQELELVYQPKIDIRDNSIIGVEALVRWHHPDLGLVLPDRFVPLAEETDLILPMGDWVIVEACRQMKAWQVAGLGELTVSVNVSSRQLRHGDLVEKVAAALAETGLEPEFLEIEITEGTLVEDTGLATRTLERLRTMGVQVSIDDFGTGYSSLGYLQRLPIDRLKIDRTFVLELPVSDDAKALSAAVVGLAASLHLDVVAEGVETIEQLEILESLNCFKVQGFLIARPLRVEQARQFLEDGPPALLSRDRSTRTEATQSAI